jgi:hypothetical protein
MKTVASQFNRRTDTFYLLASKRRGMKGKVEEESNFKALFNILTNLSRYLSEEKITMSSAYKRTLKSGEARDKHMGDM